MTEKLNPMNGYCQPQHKSCPRKSQLTAARKQIIDYEQTEAAVCPEDVGIKEYVKALLAQSTAANEENKRLNGEIEWLYVEILHIQQKGVTLFETKDRLKQLLIKGE